MEGGGGGGGGVCDNPSTREKPVDIGCSDIILTCLIYQDPFLYNFLTNNKFHIIFHKSLMYNSFKLLHAKIY